MAGVIPIGEPGNEAERRVIAHLRAQLPNDYLILHNFLLLRHTERFEVSFAVIAPHALYLAEVKATPGPVHVYGREWYPADRKPHLSPLLQLRDLAKSLAAAISGSQPQRRDLGTIHVAPVIVLTSPDAVLLDPGGEDAPQVTTLALSAPHFQNAAAVPGQYSKDIGPLHNMLLKALLGIAVKPTERLHFKHWEVHERLGGSDDFTEYRAYNSFAGKSSGHALLRAYTADPDLPEEARAQQLTRITTAFNALNHMPGHAGIVGVRDFFATDQEDRYILVTEDVPGQALRLNMDKSNLALTLDQKLRLAADLLQALAHAHQHQVVHRNLTPSSILLGGDGRMRLVGFDFARAGTDRSTIAGEIVDELDPAYQAPEVRDDPRNASPASDVFSCGLVLYELFVGEPAFSGPSDIQTRGGQFPLKPSDLRGDVPDGLDGWLQRLCALVPGDRPSAGQAAADLTALLAPADSDRDMAAAEFIDRYLALHAGECRPLLALMGAAETDWLEFKAALIPPVERVGATKADGQWAVTKAAVALANSQGGAVLLGVDDQGNPVPLSHSDPSGYLKQEGWDGFARKVLDSGLFRANGWRTASRDVWHVDIASFKSHLEVRRATLDGKDIVVLLVKAVSESGPLLEVSHSRDGQTNTMVFVRRRGDVGVVDKFEDPDKLAAWLRTRQLTSPRFRQLLEASRTIPRTGLDYSCLAVGTQLTSKYVVQGRLGKPGTFGAVYKVIDTLGDVTRAMKIIFRDRYSTLNRLKKEYRTLLRVPEHPYVVKVIDADLLPGGGPPFIVFEYIEGQEVGEMMEKNLFAPSDALDLARQTTEGLVHLHRHGVFHCDIKPRNLLWTRQGVRIIDFNVSVLATSDNDQGGGSKKYRPPDLDPTQIPQWDLADRDLYALGITLYEVVCGRYPWAATTPPPGQEPDDPRKHSELGGLAPEFVDLILKTISPKRVNRFVSAVELQAALENIRQARRPRREAESSNAATKAGFTEGSPVPPNTNPFVNRLLSLYSQSKQTNAGTRGLDAFGEQTYVETALDRDLEPAVLGGEFRLVIITGNAGDGKTAFLQRLEKRAGREQADFAEPLPNGRSFVLHGLTFMTNYDGSQDEGTQTSDDVLRAFLAPFAGMDDIAWPADQVRIIAINEGRLIDFLTTETAQFPLLERVVRRGLVTNVPEHGVVVVNLNLRSVVSDPMAFESDPRGGDESIFARMLRRLTAEAFWQPCHGCDLKDRCYAFHNARSFQDETAGPKIIERLKTLYTLTHLRGRLHITLRDLRSALAYLLVGTRDCAEIHDLYRGEDREAIIQGFYFNSWMGGDPASADRLLTLLKDVDMGMAIDPRLDRAIDFVSPAADRGLFSFDLRGSYDREVLRRYFDDLPRDFTGRPTQQRATAHQRYVAMARRRAFFERRDDGWPKMLPYRSAERMLRLVTRKVITIELVARVIRAINRGEGLTDPDRLGGNLALQVRHVERGTVRSYRVFTADRFGIDILDPAGAARFVEHMPSGLVLQYRGAGGNRAELRINLDVFEMLERLNQGYRPSIEEEQGYYLSLAVFKNRLGSEPYQEVLLTTTGHDFYRVVRHEDGRLEMSRPGLEVV